MGGWSLYVWEGKLKYCYNYLGIEYSFTEGSESAPSGTHQVRMEFEYDGGGIEKGGTVTLHVDGRRVGRGRVERVQLFLEGNLQLGTGAGAPVSPDYKSGFAFTGSVNWVEIELMTADQLMSAEDFARMAMARQ